MTLIFGNFPHPVGMWGCVENCKTSIFLHRLVCGNPGLKSSLSGPWKIKNHVCWFLVVFCFFVCFCMIWSYIIIFSPPEHRKHHLNLKWGGSIFWFRPISCTHFATPQHMPCLPIPASLPFHPSVIIWPPCYVTTYHILDTRHTWGLAYPSLSSHPSVIIWPPCITQGGLSCPSCYLTISPSCITPPPCPSTTDQSFYIQSWILFIFWEFTIFWLAH